MRALLVVALAALVAPAFVASAGHSVPCPTPGPLATGTWEINTGSQGTYYVDDRDYVTGSGLWIYEESNGFYQDRGFGVYNDEISHSNLQRGGASPFVPDDADVCVDDPLVIPDLLIL